MLSASHTRPRSAARTSSKVAPHGTIIILARLLDPAFVETALDEGCAVGWETRGQGAEVDARGGLGAVQRHMDLARALAADQGPLRQLKERGLSIEGRSPSSPLAAAWD